MDPYATPDFLYEMIKKCTQTEFSQASLSQIKVSHATLGLKNSNKKKDDLISDIFRYLANILVKQTQSGQFKDGFPLFNQKNELFQRNASIRHLIDTCNQKIHIANVHLAQINYNRLNQVKKALNLSEGQSLCICSLTIDATTPKETLIKCINQKCGKLLHKACMKVTADDDESQLFECPECVLFKCDPLHEVIKTLIYPYVVDNQSREFWIDEMIHKEIHSNEALGIEVRVINLESRSHEHCWPHQGELEVNQFRCLEFKPLQSNSSLKKRKDERYYTNDIVSGLNTVKLKYTPGSDPRNPQAEETYIAAVYLVRKLPCEDLIQRVKEGNRRSLEDCKRMIIEDFENSPLDIDKVVCQLTCVFDMQPLKTPAKGLHCRHPSCFSLENYVNLWQKNGQRRWVCPICKVKAYDIVVDSYMEKMLEDIKKSGFGAIGDVDVEIMRNADYRFVKNEVEKENNDEQKTETKVEKPNDKGVDVIILDSDEEAPANPPVATENGNVQKERLEEEVKEKEATEEKENGKEDTAAPAMEVEAEKPKPTMEEESKEPANKPEDKPEEAGSKEASDKKMEEEKTEKDPTILVNIEDTEDHTSVPARTSDNHIDTTDMTRPDDHMNEVRPVSEKGKGKAREVVMEEEVPVPEKTSKSKKADLVSQQEQQARAEQQQQALALEQLQQLQASEEYRLQQQRQQQLQQQQRLQWLAESFAPNMGQNLQGVNLATLFGTFGSNPNVFQQAVSSIPGLLVNQLKAKLQQPLGRASPEDLAALLLGDSPYKALLGGDMNYLNLLRQMNGLAMLQSLGVNGMNGINQIPALSGLNMLNGLNPALLEVLAQQQNKANEVPYTARNIASPTPPVASTTPKPQASKRVAENENNSSTLGNVVSRQLEPVPVIPYKRKNENAPKIFKIGRELAADRVTEDANKSLEKLIELAEKKLDLPSFESYKEMTYPEMKKVKEPNLQKNKKLVALVMKQFPGQYRSSKQAKAAEEQEPTPRPASVSANEPMETEEKEQDQEQEKQEEQQKQQEEQKEEQKVQQQELANVKDKGQESDPICLE